MCLLSSQYVTDRKDKQREKQRERKRRREGGKESRSWHGTG